MEVFECVSFMVIRDNHILLEKRSKQKKSDPNTINIPGGHMELGESQSETLFRELQEELTIKPTSFKYLCSLYHPTSELQLIHYYVVSSWIGELDAQEADEVIWFDLNHAPVDIEADKIAISEYLRLNDVI